MKGALAAGDSAGNASRNRWTGAVLAGVVALMLGLTAVSAPLYSLFCQVTGFGGTTSRAVAAPSGPAGQTVTVSFNADTGQGLPWRFKARQANVGVRTGDEQLAFYTAENRGDGPIVGRAVYNVTPHKAGPYFSKLACFCFEEQVLEAGQTVEMPVSFYVDPALHEDPATRDVRQITLSYTFFIDAEATAALRRERGSNPQG